MLLSLSLFILFYLSVGFLLPRTLSVDHFRAAYQQQRFQHQQQLQFQHRFAVSLKIVYFFNFNLLL